MTTDRPHSWRSRLTSARDDQYIVTCALRQRTLHSRRLREQFRAGTNINVSDQTIHNRLYMRNLRTRRPVIRQHLTRQHRIVLHPWALVHRRLNRAEWRLVIHVFSNKSRYNEDRLYFHTLFPVIFSRYYAAAGIGRHKRKNLLFKIY